MWLDGVWVDVDGTLGTYAPTQSHIALAINDLSDSEGLSSSFAVVTVMGRLKVTPMGSAAWPMPKRSGEKGDPRRR
jgi:hypothetical protein